MGSFNVTCQVTGHTIGHKTKMVGFFVKPAPVQEDDSHRPDEPLKSMFGQWVPAHLPVRGYYEDYGQMFTDSATSKTSIEHAKKHADGFDFSEKAWEEHPLSDHDSKYRFWQIRADVYQFLVDLGTKHPDGLLSENEALLTSALSDVDPKSKDYKEAISFFSGLNALGYGFREMPYNTDQCASNDHELMNSLQNRIQIEKQTDLGPVAELPGGFVVRCGLTGNPIRVGEKMHVLPLIAAEAKDYDKNGRLRRVSNFGVSPHYELMTSGYVAWFDENGSLDIAADRNKEVMIETTKEMLFGFKDPEEENRHLRKFQRVSAMVISESAYNVCKHAAMNTVKDMLGNEQSRLEFLAMDYEQIKSTLDKAREAFKNEDPDAIVSLFEDYGIEDIVSERIKELNDPEKRKIRLAMTKFSFMDCLPRLEAKDSEFYRTNGFSKILDSSRTPLDLASVIHLRNELMDYIDGDSDPAKGIEDTLSYIGVIAQIDATFDYIGMGLRPTEPQKLGVDPQVCLNAWESLNAKVLRNLGKEIRAWHQEMEY